MSLVLHVAFISLQLDGVKHEKTTEIIGRGVARDWMVPFRDKMQTRQTPYQINCS